MEYDQEPERRPGKVPARKSNIPLGKPNHVIIYKLKYPGHQIVQEYYQWRFTNDPDDNVYVTSCPGCGKELKTKWLGHRCEGSLTDHPLVRFKSIWKKAPKPVDDSDDSEYNSD
jgi:hypothetical protein